MYIVVLNVLYDDVYMYKSLQINVCYVLFCNEIDSSSRSVYLSKLTCKSESSFKKSHKKVSDGITSQWFAVRAFASPHNITCLNSLHLSTKSLSNKLNSSLLKKRESSGGI